MEKDNGAGVGRYMKGLLVTTNRQQSLQQALSLPALLFPAGVLNAQSSKIFNLCFCSSEYVMSMMNLAQTEGANPKVSKTEYVL
jgi:hypothetical protein